MIDERDLMHPDTVLVIDDEIDVRMVVARIIRRLGWKALTATDGRDGIELVCRYPFAIGCVILDMQMPGLSGPETFHELRKVAPELPVVLCSGFGNGQLSADPALITVPFLRKPFTIDELRTVLCQVLPV